MKKILPILIFLFISISTPAQTLLLYGGSGHDEFLGELNSSEYSGKSIWNEYGRYGNKYNQYSIWNEYGEYGNKYGSYSPFNAFASNPPVIVDSDGNFYGYFTVNEYKANRATFELACIIYEYYEDIRDDVSKWRDRIFK